MTHIADDTHSRDILGAAHQDDRRRALRRWVPKVCGIVSVVGVLNFLLFLAVAMFLGGDAMNGKVAGAKYYLWGYHDGQKDYFEVSRAVFKFSLWHAYSVMFTLPLAVAAALISRRIERLPED